MSLAKCKAILVPVDFSPSSLAAVQHAIFLGGLLKADVTLLHVIHDPEDAPGYYHRGKKDLKKRVRFISDAAQEMMGDFIKEHDLNGQAKSAGIKLERHCVNGIPSATINDTADKKRYGLVVIGSRGQTGLKRLLLGSVAERVVNRAGVPVLVVKAANGG